MVRRVFNEPLTADDMAKILEGTYKGPRPPHLDFDGENLFLGVYGISMDGDEVELCDGLKFRRSYARIFSSTMVAPNKPTSLSAPNPSPWHPLYNSGINLNIEYEILLSDAKSFFGHDRTFVINYLPFLLRLYYAASIFIPTMSNFSFEEARDDLLLAPFIRHEREPSWSTGLAKIDSGLGLWLQRLFDGLRPLMDDPDMQRAIVIADSVWWQSNSRASILMIWTSIEIMMRPGNYGKGSSLADSISRYTSLRSKDIDKIKEDVGTLYKTRGSTVHAGRVPQTGDISASYGILRAILLRSLCERKRPPEPADITPWFHEQQ